QHLRLVDERARQGHALLLAARELARLAAPHSPEADDLQHLLDAPLQRVAPHALAPKAERDVLVHGEVREERVRLEHGVDVALVRRQPADLAFAEVDLAPARLLEAADHPQRRRLAAARRPEQREEAAALDLETEVVDRDDVVELLRDVDEPHIRLLRHCRTLVQASASTSPRMETIWSNSP